MQQKTQDTRTEYLKKWASQVLGASRSGVLSKGKPIQLQEINAISGPRAAALEIDAGFQTGLMLRRLSENDYALHRQLIPWPFIGEPIVFMRSRFVRLEAGWSEELAIRDILISQIGQNPKGGGRWIAGVNEQGATLILGVTKSNPHYLFAGQTGSGKTWAIRSAVAQLSRDPSNKLVFIDGKYGAGLGPLANMPGVQGPIATDPESAARALGWVLVEMRRRYEAISSNPRGAAILSDRIIVVADEIQRLSNSKTGNATVTAMLGDLMSQGREAGVHVILSTQHPVMEALGGSQIKSNLTGRVALRVDSPKASEVALGASNPRADHLLGAGDAYVVVPGAEHRTMIAYYTEAEITEMQTRLGRETILSSWPEVDGEEIGSLPTPETVTSKAPEFTAVELAIGLIQGQMGAGRPLLMRALNNAGFSPGSVRAARLLSLSKEVLGCLSEQDWSLVPNDLTDEFEEELETE